MCACGVCVLCESVVMCNVWSVLCMYIRMVWHILEYIIGILEDMNYQIVLLLSVCAYTYTVYLFSHDIEL